MIPPYLPMSKPKENKPPLNWIDTSWLLEKKLKSPRYNTVSPNRNKSWMRKDYNKKLVEPLVNSGVDSFALLKDISVSTKGNKLNLNRTFLSFKKLRSNSNPKQQSNSSNRKQQCKDLLTSTYLDRKFTFDNMKLHTKISFIPKITKFNASSSFLTRFRSIRRSGNLSP